MVLPVEYGKTLRPAARSTTSGAEPGSGPSFVDVLEAEVKRLESSDLTQRTGQVEVSAADDILRTLDEASAATRRAADHATNARRIIQAYQASEAPRLDLRG